MEVREAVKRAKSYLSDVFADETAEDIRLEEVQYDDRAHAWLITLGFLPKNGPAFERLGLQFQGAGRERSYKIVRISEDENERPSIKIREFAVE